MATFKNCRITFANGYTQESSLNPSLTEEEVKRYYLDRYFNVGSFNDEGEEVEDMQECVSCEILGLETY